MKIEINGIEYDSGTTVSEFVEMQKLKGEFEESAEGFKTNMTDVIKPVTVQELIDRSGE